MPAASHRLRLDLAYDGTAFSGWSRQPGLRTVQGELEAALATVFRRTPVPPTLTVAGRTDAGVHALGQVAHLDLDDAQLGMLDAPHRGGDRSRAPMGAAALARRLNGIAGLDSDVWIARATRAPAGFDARFSAVWRRYEYRVADAVALKDPRRRSATLWHPVELDVAAMDAAAAALTGLHDWAAYCKPREGATTIRTLQSFSWHRDADGVLVARLQADAFCHSMVRALVGGSMAVGAGRLAPERLAGIRDEARRGSEFIVAPAKGLTLMEVGYPPDSELAARAEQTRARRDAGEVDAPHLTGSPSST
ncbi:tRNA pseudouridine(38-40) synthase TruA [Schumannella sp. 10F1B-5-1]|nr:tRNA pseudouridine(38-40) synthase TruA [Schumannella sp. 10F1B-5-1]